MREDDLDTSVDSEEKSDNLRETAEDAGPSTDISENCMRQRDGISSKHEVGVSERSPDVR